MNAVDAARVRCDMLVAGGMQDRFISPGVARRVARKYGAPCWQYPLNAHFLPMEPGRAAFFVFREMEIFLVGLPVALWGMVNNLLPYQALKALVRKTSSDRDHWASNAVVMGVVAFQPMLRAGYDTRVAAGDSDPDWAPVISRGPGILAPGATAAVDRVRKQLSRGLRRGPSTPSPDEILRTMKLEFRPRVRLAITTPS